MDWRLPADARLGTLACGRYAQVMSERSAYPSDLSDARWELVLAAWRYERHGRGAGFSRPPQHDLNWNTAYGYFAKWQADGIFIQLNILLRELVRQREGRSAGPSACVIDAQSVKTATSIPATSQGTDAGRKIVGRKRTIVTDALGLLLAVLVTAAGIQGSVAGTQLLDKVAATLATVRLPGRPQSLPAWYELAARPVAPAFLSGRWRPSRSSAHLY